MTSARRRHRSVFRRDEGSRPKDKLKRLGVYTGVGENSFFATIGEGVNGNVADQEVEWVEWEERE